MKYRIKFSKNGPIKYIGHLDTMRYFQKALRRAKLPVAYSEGFSPHQIMSFAFPLSVGYTSEGEYFDIEMTESVNVDTIISHLNNEMADGINIISVRELPEAAANCMSCVFAAKYNITIKDNIELPSDYINIFNDFFGQSTIMVNKPKKKGGGFINIDLKEFIYSYNISDRTMTFTVNASSSDNIRPSFIAELFLNLVNISPNSLMYNIHRVDILGRIGEDDNYKLVSLMDV